MKASLRTSFATLVGSVALLVAPAAFAAGEPCLNDTDCPGGGMACGGEVCNWMLPQGEMFTCNAAGTQTPKGRDGWCTTIDNCKCKAEGATCKAPYCTFTKASEAPAGGGSGAGGAGTAGAPTAGASTAGASTAGTGTTTAPPADEGGCSVSLPGRTSSGIALGLGLGLAGLGFALLRRRR